MPFLDLSQNTTSVTGQTEATTTNVPIINLETGESPTTELDSPSTVDTTVAAIESGASLEQILNNTTSNNTSNVTEEDLRQGARRRTTSRKRDRKNRKARKKRDSATVTSTTVNTTKKNLLEDYTSKAKRILVLVASIVGGVGGVVGALLGLCKSLTSIKEHWVKNCCESCVCECCKTIEVKPEDPKPEDSKLEDALPEEIPLVPVVVVEEEDPFMYLDVEDLKKLDDKDFEEMEERDETTKKSWNYYMRCTHTSPKGILESQCLSFHTQLYKKKNKDLKTFMEKRNYNPFIRFGPWGLDNWYKTKESDDPEIQALIKKFRTKVENYKSKRSELKETMDKEEKMKMNDEERRTIDMIYD